MKIPYHLPTFGLAAIAVLLFLTPFPQLSSAQTQPPPHNQLRSGPTHTPLHGLRTHNIPVLMASDIHFDPFQDPAKVKQLVAAPATQWEAILATPASPGQQQAFDTLQQQCHAKGVDTPYILLRSSLQAMHTQQSDAQFITVSGDLIAHAFSCRYRTLMPQATQADYESFVLKTISFVIANLRASFPGIPVYAALGNNDTGCGDYQLDPNSDFLTQTGKILATGLPASQQAQAIQQFPAGGYYSVTMAAPMQSTRLIVINDLFLSPKYTTCGSLPNASAATSEIAWLAQQLADARKAGQKVWIMGHIPPGVNPYSTAVKGKNICAKSSPTMFLASDKLSDTMIENSDVIRLAIFAHTHMDELRLLKSDSIASSSDNTVATKAVALKMVPSISPVDGNNPSFTIARIDPTTAILQNYEVFAASNQTGIGTFWTKEYDFADIYHQPQFSPQTVSVLIEQFSADSQAKLQISDAYIHNFFVGDRSLELKPFWSEYVCGLSNVTAKSFTACVCSNNE